MAQYQVWIEADADYSKVAFIRHFASLEYKQALSGMGYATLDLLPEDSNIAVISVPTRLKIIRNGDIVFGGRILREGWAKPETAPGGETWRVHAVDHSHYAMRRRIVPAPGSAYDSKTDNADDSAKYYVYTHLGAGAAAARRFSDLTIQADASAAPSVGESGRYGTVYDKLMDLALKGGFDWRFVPGAAGCEFRTAYPQWGLDRTKGNGVNDECIFSVDRRTFRQMGYTFDAIDHVNFVYVAGQGEAENRAVVERSTAGDIATYGRCEGFSDARHLSLTASLEAYGDKVLADKQPAQSMSVQPQDATWRATSGTTWDLGDLVTAYAREWGRTFSMDAKVVAVTVSVTPDHLEKVLPVLEAV